MALAFSIILVAGAVVWIFVRMIKDGLFSKEFWQGWWPSFLAFILPMAICGVCSRIMDVSTGMTAWIAFGIYTISALWLLGIIIFCIVGEIHDKNK